MKSLICITTCKRLSEVKKYIWDYLRFVNNNESFHFVLALDGTEQEHLDFCNEFTIPLIYSEEREGVGLSKNRVLTQFPNYDNYFFIEDDIELVDNLIFQQLVDLHEQTGYHHFCNNHSWNKVKVETINGEDVLFSSTGGAQLAFYSREGIKRVGGFHTLFAKYRRFGHTEHSYRFYHTNLQPAPFIFPLDFKKHILIHAPEAVIRHSNIQTNENELIADEQVLIDQKNTYFPLRTLSPFYFNGTEMGYNETVAQFLKDNPQKYPLTHGKERKLALGEYYALLIDWEGKSFFKNLLLVLRSIRYAPTNNALKHKIKMKIVKNR